ncbi:MAG: Fur family transcriptional regulator [Fidelibacterota bacterium]
MKKPDQFRAILQKEGLKYTKQRQAVWDEICSTTTHRDAEDIYLTIVKRGLRVSRATVYRTIDVLVKNKMVRKLELGEGRARYEHRLDVSHHDHLVCRKCGKIVEFVDDRIESLQEVIVRQHGFELDYHSHQLFGVCSSCREQ